MVASCQLPLAGCPAAPDKLNILMEPFHRWAAAQELEGTGGRQESGLG